MLALKIDPRSPDLHGNALAPALSWTTIGEFFCSFLCPSCMVFNVNFVGGGVDL